MVTSRTLVVTIALGLGAAACRQTAPPPPAAAVLVERSHPTMGTELKLTAWIADRTVAETAFSEVFGEFDRLENLMSVWRDGSDIVRLNAAAGDHPVPISPDVKEALVIGRQVSEWTDGTFDVTFAALDGLWKFDTQNKDNTVPDPREIAKRLPLINYRDLDIDEQASTAFLKRKGMRVNLGGIGKGYAVDHGVAILRKHGLKDFMIQAGGDLYVSGQRGDRPWRLGIRDPRGPADKIFAAIDLSNGTFSTSGDYERFFLKDGKRYHHIIDVRVGQPARACRSVTLVTDRAVIADALAKGVFILGPEGGMALIERLPHVEGVIVSANNEVLVSSGLKDRLVRLSPPTDGE
jgi:thiamine biosynthesis lipoprotein